METTLRDIILPALALLPPRMTSIRAQVMLLAIGQQESELHYRRQWPAGPARGLWQFERDGGVAGVMRHHATREIAKDLCWRCGVAATVSAVYHSLDRDDVLAAGMARLLLWTLPNPLPGRGEVEHAWGQYMVAWRPGKPKMATWADNYEAAWDAVLGTVKA